MHVDLSRVHYSYEEDAEAKCERAVQAALTSDASSYDAALCLANLRLSQNRKTDAADTLRELCTRLKALRGKLRSRTVIQELGAPSVSESYPDPELEGSGSFFLFVITFPLIGGKRIYCRLAWHRFLYIGG